MKPSRSAFRLTVLSGPNAGASAGLEAGRTVIGGSAADAIVLDGALPAQLAVTLHDERVRLAAGGPGIAIGDDHSTPQRLPQGQTAILPLPVMVRMNDETLLNLSRRVPVRGRLVPAATAALTCIIALASGLLIGLQMPDSVIAASRMSAEAAAPRPAEPPPLAETVAPRGPSPVLQAMSPQIGPCTDECHAEARDRLQDSLDAAGLNGLSVKVESGVLRVTGALAPEQAQRWGELRRDFETTYVGSLPLLVNIGAEGVGPSLAVSSIWLGPRPELRTRSGAVMRIGDRTSDGWTVKAIARGAITLTRDEAETVVRF